MMNEIQKNYLETRLVDTCMHMAKTKEDKKQTVAGFTEEINGAQKRVDALCLCIKSADFSALQDVFDDSEIDTVMAM